MNNSFFDNLSIQEQTEFATEYGRWLNGVEAAYAFREEVFAWEESNRSLGWNRTYRLVDDFLVEDDEDDVLVDELVF